MSGGTLESAQADILQLLGSLSASDNPYAAIRVYLRRQLLPNIPYSATCQLYFLAAVLGLSALLILASLGIRWRKGVFWVWRLQQSPRVVRPHWSVSWSVITVLVLVLMEAYISSAIDFFQDRANPRLGYWFLVVWGVAWWAGHTAAWSLGVSYLLHRNAMGHDVTVLAHCANVFGLVIPIAYFAIELPLAIIGGKAYYDVIGYYNKLDDLLSQASTQWTPGQQVNIISLAPAIPLIQQLARPYETFHTYFRVLCGFYCATCITAVICLSFIATVYLTSLRRALQSSQRGLAVSQNSSNVALRSQQAQVERTFRSLLFTIVAFCCLGAVFTPVAVIAASSPRALASSPLRAQILILLPLYAFTVFGLPCAVLLVLRAYEADAASEGSGGASTSRSGPRSRASGTGTASKSHEGDVHNYSSAGALHSRELSNAIHPGAPRAAFSLLAIQRDRDDAQHAADLSRGGVQIAVDVEVDVDDVKYSDEKRRVRP